MSEELLALFDEAQTDLIFHVKEIQGVDTMEPFQETLIRAVREFERVVCRACHDVGKTWTLAHAVLAIGSSFPGCKIVTTAPTSRQVELLLWSEIRAGHAASKFPLGGKILTKKWEFSPDWWAIGFTTQKNAGTGQGQTNSGFQGIHSKELVFVIFDEATGIPVDVWKQLEGLMTSAFVRFVGIGNPTTKACEFYKCFSDPLYKKLHISCFDSPNLIANGIVDIESLVEELDRLKEMDEAEKFERLHSYKVVRPHLLTCRWVMGMALKLGIDHPLFVSKCLGEFPNEDERCLMPLGLVEESQRRESPKDLKTKRFFFGVDPARYGSDMSVITKMEDIVVKKVKSLAKRATTVIAGEVVSMVNDIPDNDRTDVTISIDATGIGSGVVDILREYQSKHQIAWRGIKINELHFGETFKEGRDGSEKSVKEKSSEFVNKKAHMFVLLAQDLKKELVLPEKSDFYSEQLPTIIYSFDSRGRWVIEDKEKYKKRTGRSSPDEADSLALANYGRHYNGGIGCFTENMAKPQGKTLAGRFNRNE